MGTRVYQILKCWHLKTPHSCFESRKSLRAVPSLPRRNVTDSNTDMPCRLVYNSSSLCGSRNLRMPCFSYFDDVHHEETMNLIEEVAKNLDPVEKEQDKGNAKKVAYEAKPDILDPCLLGIQPEPPSWPERDEMLRLNFERRVSSVELPFSIRMIKKKLQWQEGASELSHCSVNKIFSSVLFIIHELQNCVFQTRESFYSEDLQAEMRENLDDSFLWLFQHIFWKTPSLMVNVMVLLANFSVFSICSNTAMITENKNEQQHSQDEYGKELTEGEELLWNLILEEEASRGQKEIGTDGLNHDNMPQFVAPVHLEGDQYKEYDKTSLHYRLLLLQAPDNSLVLSNYAQFLYLVVHDLDGAEEYFKRSVLAEPPDAEAFSRYADFLWLERKDLWAAEERYLQALEADHGSGNTFYASKYARFLWSTCGDDVCFYPPEDGATW